MLGKKLSELRIANHMTQDAVADKLNVSRQTVQKWERGAALPTLDKLIRLTGLFHITLDSLCRDVKYGADFSGRIGEELLPNYSSIDEWELWSKALTIEYRQCSDEGKAVENYKELFEAINRLPATAEKEKMCDALFSLISKLPDVPGYPYFEPNDIETIRAERKEYKLSLKEYELDNKLLGGWYGRICGCLLGKPVEGIHSNELKVLCKASKNYPLKKYIFKNDLPEDIEGIIQFPISKRAYPIDLGYMPFDDDTNYMVMALHLLKKFGRDFSSKNVAEIWLSSQPKTAYYTAEKIAYMNLVNGFLPPDSACYKNAYREWIGAQIRGDVFGYINPCDPETAAEMAWRDARISHIKNGIYGEMWVSAMIALAYGTDDMLSIIRGGLAQIPSKSRLYNAVESICSDYESGVEKEACFSNIAKRWNEANVHDWCHTISNAEIVTAALLYGKGDYGKSICLAVEQGFDTDCNGATVGSVLGVVLGYEKIPAEWTSVINDTLETTICGYNTVSVKKMAEETKAFCLLK